MTALYIIGGTAAFFALLLCFKVRLRIYWCGGFGFDISYLFIKKHFFADVSTNENDSVQNVETKKKEKSEESEKKERVTLSEGFSLIKDALKIIFSKLKKHIKIDRFIIKVCVATDNPAETALLYVPVKTAVDSIGEFVLSRKSANSENVIIKAEADFVAEHTDVVTDIALSARLFGVLSLLFTVIKTRYKLLNPKSEK